MIGDMDEHQNWFTPFAGVLGVVVGFILATLKESVYRRQRLRAHWSALHVELQMCQRSASVYLDTGVVAPLYRLPTKAFDSSLAALLTEGDVRASELKPLTRCALKVQEINRGLDRVAVPGASQSQGWEQEAGRLRAKFEEFLKGTSTRTAESEEALVVVIAHLPRA